MERREGWVKRGWCWGCRSAGAVKQQRREQGREEPGCASPNAARSYNTPLPTPLVPSLTPPSSPLPTALPPPRRTTPASSPSLAQNAEGAGLAPFDSWLALRGLKTMALRMERSAANCARLAEWLARQPLVKKVNYPGLPQHAGYALHARQATSAGALLSFETGAEAWGGGSCEGGRGVGRGCWGAGQGGWPARVGVALIWGPCGGVAHLSRGALTALGWFCMA